MKRLHKKSNHNQSIYCFSSAYTRAMQVGFIQKKYTHETFIPGRLNTGVTRQNDTFEATKESLKLPEIQDIIKRYKPEHISTITLLRETLSCQLGKALYDTGIKEHYGDAYIGATHIKGDGDIRTAYLYENTEGLKPDGLWIIGESFCMGRNLAATMKSLLSQFSPKEIVFIAPLASLRAINYVEEMILTKHIPTTFVAWGGLFGVDEKTLYDMPWGHPDSEPVDERDRQTFIHMYSKDLCVGGDFGNNYYSPTIAKKLYHDQLKEHSIEPIFPPVEEIKNIYKPGEILVREEK